MTSPDPNVTTTPEGETVVLEPGDPGYVDPATQQQGAQPTADEPNAVLDAQPMPADAGPPPEPPQDLRLVNDAGQSESEAILRSRGQVVESTSPSDIVPNTPQIRPFPTEATEEVVEEEEEEGEEVVQPTEPDLLASPEQPPALQPEARAGASDLIDRARAATTTAELDEIEQQADGRVTVLNAVEARRAELAQ